MVDHRAVFRPLLGQRHRPRPARQFGRKRGRFPDDREAGTPAVPLASRSQPLEQRPEQLGRRPHRAIGGQRDRARGRVEQGHPRPVLARQLQRVAIDRRSLAGRGVLDKEGR